MSVRLLLKHQNFRPRKNNPRRSFPLVWSLCFDRRRPHLCISPKPTGRQVLRHLLPLLPLLRAIGGPDRIFLAAPEARQLQHRRQHTCCHKGRLIHVTSLSFNISKTLHVSHVVIVVPRLGIVTVATAVAVAPLRR